jgi:chorismate mutase
MQRLTEYRDMLDNIDDSLISILSKRFKITDEVGLLKREKGMPPVDAEREQEQFERVRELAALHGLEPEIAEKVLRLIIDMAVERHQLIQSNSG